MSDLFVTPEFFFPADNGGKVATYNYFKRFHRADTTLVAFYDKEKVSAEDAAARCRREFTIRGIYLIPFHIRIRRNPPMLLRTAALMVLKAYPYLAAKFYSPEMARTVLRAVGRERVETVILDRLNLLYLAPLIHRVSPKVKFIQISHNNESEIAGDFSRDKAGPLPVRLMAALESRLIDRFQRNHIDLMSQVYCISAVDARLLNERFRASRFTYYPMPYYFDRPFEFKVPDRPTAGICSSLTWPPNIEGLLWYIDRIHPAIMEKIPGYRFVVAGSHASRDLGRKLNETEGVEYLGYVDDLKDFYDRCAVVIVPLLSGSGIRIKILDSFSYSKPVVATLKAVQGLELTSGKEICFEETEEAFIEAAVRLINNVGLQKQIARRGYEYLTSVHGPPAETARGPC